MIYKVFLNLGKYIGGKDSVVVGVSGGPDSTALLDLLSQFYEKEAGELGGAGKVIVAHVNHGVRGKESDGDENFVKNLAKKYGFKFFVKRIKLAGKSSMEERGREARREFFEKLREKFKAKFIVTAHTFDDNAETILFNFLRGSGIKGLAGMQMQNGFYLKPLLDIPKKEILKYLKAKKLKFCIDRTNKDTKYSRNLIRNKIIPLVEKINPSFKQTLSRNGAIFRDLGVWLDAEAGKFLAHQKFSLKNPTFNSKDFLKLPDAVQQSVIQLAFKQVTEREYQISNTKIGEIILMLNRNIGNKKIYTDKNCVFTLGKGVVRVVRAN